MSHSPRPRPFPVFNSSLIALSQSRLCLAQNMIICNLIDLLLKLSTLLLLLTFSYCITGILTYSPAHNKIGIYYNHLNK